MGGTALIWLLLLQSVFIVLNAVFACAEIAVISANDNRMVKLANEGEKRAIRVVELMLQPAGFLATIQVGITLVNLLSSAVATQNFADPLTAWLNGLGLPISRTAVGIISITVVTLVLTYFTVLLAELVPKRIAMHWSERIALAMSGFVYGVSVAFKPVIWLFTVSTNGILRLLGIDPAASDQQATAEEEIQLILDSARPAGDVDPQERELITNVFEFDDISVEAAMTHRNDVQFLWMEQNDKEWDRIIRASGHSIYPVCEGTRDNFVGLLYSKNYMREAGQGRKTILEKAVVPAVFVPETVSADVVFQQMKQTRKHFAIVVDEFDGMAGIVTINDLLEKLVGDLGDDVFMPPPSPLIEPLGEGKWRVSGSAKIERVSEQLEISVPSGDFATFGGYVFALLGSVPADGQTPTVEDGNVVIEVEEVKGRRLRAAYVTVRPPTEPDR